MIKKENNNEQSIPPPPKGRGFLDRGLMSFSSNFFVFFFTLLFFQFDKPVH